MNVSRRDRCESARAVRPRDPRLRRRLQGHAAGQRRQGPNDTVIRTLEVKPGWPIAGSTGIAAEFIGSNLRTSEFDEDSGGEDELYARVSFYDCHLGGDRDFVTGGFYGFF